MDIQKQQVEARTYLGKTATLKIAELENNPHYENVYNSAFAHFKEHNVQPTGPAVAVYKTWDPEKGETSVMPAFTVAADTPAGDFEVLNLDAAEAYVGIHKGPYMGENGLKAAHEAMMKHMQEDGAGFGRLTVEEYVVYPQEGVKEEDLETRLIYYV